MTQQGKKRRVKQEKVQNMLGVKSGGSDGRCEEKREWMKGAKGEMVKGKSQ